MTVREVRNDSWEGIDPVRLFADMVSPVTSPEGHVTPYLCTMHRA